MNITETDPEMVAKRERLIRELRSGNWSKCTGELVALEERYFDVDRAWAEDYDNPKGHCCIGVACRLIGYNVRELDTEDNRFYHAFAAEYGVTEKQRFYLMSMNDGSKFQWPMGGDGFGATYINSNPIYRVSGNQRDFKFIARFLEVIWGMRVA